MQRVISLLLLCLLPSLAVAQAKREPLAERVKKGIDGGVRYLTSVQRENGSFELGSDVVSNASVRHPGGKTALAIMGLLNAGVPPADRSVARALAYLRTVQADTTYVVALQAMAFSEANLPEDRQRIQDNVKWLLDARVYKDGELIGWSYEKRPSFIIADNSNTQYAVLGLWSAKQIGIDIPEEAFKQIAAFYVRIQDKEQGSWRYAVGKEFGALNAATITMTTAGLCGLLVAGMEMGTRRETLLPDGTASGCGIYDENPAVAKALSWLGANFEIGLERRVFYHLYGVERAGRLSGLRYFGGHDWYREGCHYLVERQKPNGSWELPGLWDNWPEVSTSFALLFLSKGRTPVLMSKLVHGSWPRRETDTDWNNDRNDLRHLVDYASKRMFKMPLAWQNFDVMRALNAQAKNLQITEDDFQEVTAEMLQSPILYITGHRSPLGRFRDAEIALLKRYVENGGFILAEACCGSAEFDEGFKQLVARVWPGAEFGELPATHALYTGHNLVTPGQPYRLWGLDQGCKTVLAYSPQDFSCRWEKGKPDDPDCVVAFKLGANVIAYATGMDPPKPRLTKIDVATRKSDPASIPRGYLKVAQLKIPGDAPPAPRAMRNLLEHVGEYAGVDVALTTDHRFIDEKAVIDFKFIYLHGRKSFKFDAEEMGALRFNLQNGGLLFADACCGKEAFDQSFRKFVDTLLPGAKLEQVPLSDELYGAELNGLPLDEDTIECRKEVNGPMRKMAPWLEGVKHNGRWAVLYSKYDIGCALERHQASDCRGYSPASAQKLARAGLLYTLRP